MPILTNLTNNIKLGASNKLNINKLYAASADALKRPEVKERLAVVGGAEAVATASTAFNARIASDIERYKKVAQQVGIKPE